MTELSNEGIEAALDGDFMSLAAHLAKTNAGRPVVEGSESGTYVHRDVCIEAMQSLLAAWNRRLATQSTEAPVAWTNRANLRVLENPEPLMYAAMWGQNTAEWNVPLFAHPAPSVEAGTDGWIAQAMAHMTATGVTKLTWGDLAALQPAIASPRGKEPDTFDITRSILTEPWAVVMIDGLAILPSLPTNMPEGAASDIEAQAEQVIRHAKENGFGDGTFVWTTWHWNKPQIGEFGYVELAGYWEYKGLNPFLTRLLSVSQEGGESKHV